MSFLSRNSDLALVSAVIGILMILFAPIPSMVLDMAILLNFALGLTILLLTFYVARPVEFSTFPSLLLVATLFRLSLNVAATRLILTGANAGAVIGSIGSFAVQGSFVVGLVVFLILVVVQYVVVTSGAQRVSEVAARFVLDSVPGQQMSIDADLNMGLIDQHEAKRRRRDLEKEAAFYGAMDGASKFVKGDAIAGIVILLIDILAGWGIGVAQMGMEWAEALRTFTLLTIGDGIVTQVPALIIAVATGIIVTRSSADRELSTEVFSQLASVPKIPLIVTATLALLLSLPGMPKWPILLLAGVALVSFRALRRRSRAADDMSLVEQGSTGQDPSATAQTAAIVVAVGRELGAKWQPLKPVLVERIAALREDRERVCGVAFPAVSFRDGGQLGPFDYEILIWGSRHAKGAIYPDRTLAIRSGMSTGKLEGIEVRDPAFGLPAAWIEDVAGDQARSTGHTLVDPVTVFMTHLGEVLRIEAPFLLSRAHVVAALEDVRSRQPGLVEELVPALMAVSDVQRVLQGLLGEGVSIAAIDLIIESLADVGRSSKDTAELTELVRQRLANGICHGLRGTNDALAVMSLDPRVEAQLAENVRHGASTGMVIEPRVAEQLLRRLTPLAESMMQQSLAPVLLCGPEIRRHLKAFTRRTIPRLSVVSVSEIPHTIDLRSFAIVKLD